MSTVVRSITKRFGAVVAVDDVSFELGDREILALVGPSGCGKSTVLRAIAGLHHVDTGEIAIGGTTVDDGRHAIPPERRRVGLVFQEHALFPHLTVADNIGFGLARSPDAGRRVDELLELTGLSGYGERYPHELSGGERQRVALARALAPRPQLMLLDEPFASLDPNLRVTVRAEVVDILRNEGTPAVIVTHDQTEALSVGDRIAVMRAGRFEQLDTPETVFHRPVDQFVGAFMGEASFVPVAVEDGRVSCEVPGFGERIIEAFPDATSPFDSVMLRPDDVTFDIDASGSAIVTQAEFRGATWCYTLRLDGGPLLQSIQSHQRRVEVGTRVQPAITPGHQPVPIPAKTGAAHDE